MDQRTTRARNGKQSNKLNNGISGRLMSVQQCTSAAARVAWVEVSGFTPTDGQQSGTQDERR